MNAPTKPESLPAIINDASSIIAVIARAASDPTVDIAKIERLAALYERIQAKQAEQAFNEAMTAVQAETSSVRADATNPQTHSRYASYAAIDKALRPTYTKHGFALSFDTSDGASEGHVRVLCYVSHSAGHTRTYKADMPADGKGAKGGDVMTKTHATGSAFSYAARYLLKMVFNVTVGENDDDGNGAGATEAETGELIGPTDIAALRQLIMDADADLPKFLAFMKVERLDDIRQSDLRRGMSALRDYKAKAKK